MSVETNDMIMMPAPARRIKEARDPTRGEYDPTGRGYIVIRKHGIFENKGILDEIEAKC